MADSRTFKLVNGVTVETLGKAIESYLHGTKHMVTQAGRTANGYMVQGKSESDVWKKISGMEYATTVQLFEANDVVSVNIGAGKWSDKVGAGAIGMLVFAPLAVTAGIGTFFQRNLPGEIFDFIEKFIMSGGQTVVVDELGSSIIDEGVLVCPSCGAQNPEGTKFCRECGTKLAKVCPACNAEYTGSPKFCPSCGHPLQQELTCPQCGAAHAAGQKFCPECGCKLQ